MARSQVAPPGNRECGPGSIPEMQAASGGGVPPKPVLSFIFCHRDSRPTDSFAWECKILSSILVVSFAFNTGRPKFTESCLTPFLALIMHPTMHCMPCECDEIVAQPICSHDHQLQKLLSQFVDHRLLKFTQQRLCTSPFHLLPP